MPFIGTFVGKVTGLGIRFGVSGVGNQALGVNIGYVRARPPSGAVSAYVAKYHRNYECSVGCV